MFKAHHAVSCIRRLDFAGESKQCVAMQRQIHEWREETDEGTRVYKAVYHSKDWRIATSIKVGRRDKPEWEDLDPIPDTVWETLRDVLFRKYQRKRCPWKLIEDIDKKLGREPEAE